MSTRKTGGYFLEIEIATPSYYSVYLQDYDLQAEMWCSILPSLGLPIRKRDISGCKNNSSEDESFIEIDTLRKEIRGYNPFINLSRLG